MSNTPGTHLTNPFVGLRAFEENEDYLFFGRSNQIGELLKKFSESRFLAVIGSSGSGKSSLVKSGLLPAIYSGFMTVGSNWRVALMRPGENPIGYLTRELATEGVLYTGIKNSGIPYEPIIESSLRRSENGLVQVYKDAHLPVNENLLIVVDQFEELFRFSRYEKENKPGKSDAIHFIQILLNAARQKECPVYVLLTMRSDFLGDCAEFRGLPEAINEGQYLVPRMKRDEIREAITGPVAVSSATISQRLVTRLLNDINNDTDQLPILQHAMMRTWDAWYERNQPDTPLDFEDYEKIGTMKAALSQHADEAYAELTTKKERQLCELMFKALTDKAADLHGVRRPRSVADLCLLTGGTQAEVISVIEVFRKPGRTFLMPPPGIELTGKSIIDISHESLMRIWDKLKAWTEEEAQGADIYLRLAAAAERAEKLRKEQGLHSVLVNPELDITLKWFNETRPAAKWAEGYKGNFEQAMAFLENSRKEDLAGKEIIKQKARNRKRLVIGFLIFLTTVAIILGFLTKAARTAEQEASDNKIKADTSAAQAKRSEIAAINSAAEAKRLQLKDLLNTIKADSLRRQADTSRMAAMASEVEAIKAQHSAETSQRKTDSTLREITLIHKRALASIFREYARLIREGPSTDNKNKEKFYRDNYFLAYSYNFDQLWDSIAHLDIDVDTAAYKSLKNDLYYNNKLYQRIYENFKVLTSTDKVIRREENVKPDIRSKLNDINVAGDRVKINDRGKLTVFNISNAFKTVADTAAKTNQEFISFAVSKKQQLIFCSTNDNLIYVFNKKLERVDTINMGAKVTALDLFDDNNKSILYFGTAGGYIGYIYYDIRKKYQPVFENKLESEITAIQLFKHSYKDTHSDRDIQETFLLAAGIKSSPRVYKLDDNSLKPDSRLSGNILPYTEKEYGKITQAAFDQGSSRVILVTSTGTTYAWNPFTHELLEELKAEEDFDPKSDKTKKLLNNPEIKLY